MTTRARLSPAQVTRVRESALPPLALVKQLRAEGTHVSLRTVQRARSGIAKPVSRRTVARGARALAWAASDAVAGSDVARLTLLRTVLSRALADVVARLEEAHQAPSRLPRKHGLIIR